jgi:hypothetical protein
MTDALVVRRVFAGAIGSWAPRWRRPYRRLFVGCTLSRAQDPKPGVEKATNSREYDSRRLGTLVSQAGGQLKQR